MLKIAIIRLFCKITHLKVASYLSGDNELIQTVFTSHCQYCWSVLLLVQLNCTRIKQKHLHIWWDISNNNKSDYWSSYSLWYRSDLFGCGCLVTGFSACTILNIQWLRSSLVEKGATDWLNDSVWNHKQTEERIASNVSRHTCGPGEFTNTWSSQYQYDSWWWHVCHIHYVARGEEDHIRITQLLMR